MDEDPGINSQAGETDSMATELFSAERMSFQTLDKVLAKISKGSKAPNGKSWSFVIDDFRERTSIENGEISFLSSTEQDIRYGYYRVSDSDGKRLGSLPLINLPIDFWKDKGAYLDGNIGEMIIKITEISRKNFSDENRIPGDMGLGRLIAKLDPIEEYIVPKIVLHN